MSITNIFSFAQIIGYVAVAISFVAFSQQRDRHLRGWMMVQNIVYAWHFVLLGNYAAAASCGISAVRNGLCLWTTSWLVMLAIFAALVFAGHLFAQHAWQVLSLLASGIATFAMFRLNGIYLRLALLCGSLLWLINNILVGSLGGIGLELVAIVSNVLTLKKLTDRKNIGDCRPGAG